MLKIRRSLAQTALEIAQIRKGYELKEENNTGSEDPDKFYTINGQEAYIEIDGKPVKEYFKINPNP